MKLWFISLLLAVVSLSAQISNPLEINEEYSAKMSSGQRAYQIVDGTIYLTYKYQNGYIFLTQINPQNYQTHTIIDSSINLYNRTTDPAIQVLENGDIIIVYSEVENSDLGYLKIATSTDNGVTFNIESIEINEFGDAQIIQRNDGLDICYSSNLQGNKSLSAFQHFTEYEKSENEDGGFASGLMMFRDGDEYYGHVHSNDDIWIMQSGYGPIFHNLVTTAGRIMDYYTQAPAEDSLPMTQIFLGGYEEEIEPYEQIGLENLQTNSIQLGTDDSDIVYVKLYDGTFESMFGEIVQTGIDSFKVYSWFPQNPEEANAVVNSGGNWYEDSDHVWTNYLTMYDTIWTTGPTFPVTDQSVWVDGELWIEGEVLGAQTWGCADTVFIVGDITYGNTEPGLAPDDPDDTNTLDYFGLVSEEKILIRYKHKDPFNNMEIRDDNCTDVILYGAYAALGVGDTLVYGEMACHHDGFFTPQYQHPHGSTPDFTAMSPYTLQETLYTFVDLHKYVFPPDPMLPPEYEGFNLHGGQPTLNQTCGFPYENPAYINSYPNNIPNEYIYPYGTDYPWYNPVWPESSEDIVFERGAITMFGSLTQTRRGFAHRSGVDPYNHPNNEWNLDEYHFNGNHGPTGYEKNYYYDSRLNLVHPPNFPRVVQAPGISRNINVLHSSDGLNFSESYVEELDESLKTLGMDSDGESVLIAYQTTSNPDQFHFLISDNDPQEYELYDVDSQGSALKNAHIKGNTIYVLSTLNNNDLIYSYQIGNSTPDLIHSFDPGFNLNDFTVGESGALAYVHATLYSSNSMNLDFRYNNVSGTMAGVVSWDYPFNDFSYNDSKISIKLDEDNKVYSTILLDQSSNNYSQGELYLISGELDGIVEMKEHAIITPKVNMQIYPNPFNPETTISFSITTENMQDREVNIYNVKGQKVRSFSTRNNPELVEGSIIWNGRDMNNKTVSTGIYLFELKADGKLQKIKKGLLLK